MSIKNKVQNDWLTQLLAGFIDTFKTKNPKVFAIVALALLSINFTTDQGAILGVFEVPEVVAYWIDKATTLLGIMLGAHTFNFLPEKAQDARLNQ